MRKFYFIAIGLVTIGLNAQNQKNAEVASLSTTSKGSGSIFSMGSGASKKSVAPDVLQSENFEGFNLGDAPGQNGYLNFNGTAANYQIATDATHGKYLKQFASGGSAGTAATTYFYSTSEDIQNGWDARDGQNNILRGEVEIFTGESTNTTNGRAAVYIFNPEGRGVIGISWNANTKTFDGFLGLTLNSTGAAGGYNLSFGSDAPKFEVNKWYKVAYMYNSDTGVGQWIYPNGFVATWDNNSNNTVQVIPNLEPAELDFVVVTNLSAARTYGFDNSKLVATNEASLGVSNSVKGEISKITVYPNPTTETLSVSNTKKLLSYKVYDKSGKIVLSGEPKGTDISVSKLEKGVYVIHLVTEENGYETRQFIKK